MNDPVAVEARAEEGGALRPLAFLWRQRRYPITALGRQWEQDDERHFLVMTTDDQVYELVYLAREGAWRLRRAPGDGHRRIAV